MSYERPLLSTLRAELSRTTPVIHVLIGPRQVGKTTIARQINESIGIPTIYATADSPIPLDSAWKRYITDSLIETVLARDVIQMSKIAKPVLLRHLFALAATLPAQCVSYTKMLGQLQDAGNTTTLAHYLKLLESAFLASGLELFSRGKQRQRGSSPKLILWNNALVNALSKRTFAESLADTIWWGRLVENAVGAHLCNSLLAVEYEITYWREGNHEVDFVVARGRDIWAIEVKSGRSGKTSGLTRFRDRYSQARALLVGAQGIPLETFFNSDAGLWLV